MPHDFNVKFLRDLDENNLVSAEWTTKTGERVEGVLRLVGWRRPPAAGVADVVRRQNRAPRVTVSPRRGSAKGPATPKGGK